MTGFDPSRRLFLTGRFAPGEQAPSVALIGPSCLARRRIACMSCRDACPEGAVGLRLVAGGALPVIDAARCTACGECAAVCPADAIRLPDLASRAESDA